MALAALGFALQNVHILALCLGLMGAQSAFFSPTKNAVLPQWLSEKELITGNALMSDRLDCRGTDAARPAAAG